MSERRPIEHTVYVLLDADYVCLYVGCTSDLDYRLRQHRYDKTWWPEVAHIFTERVDGREDAFTREQQLQERLIPTYDGGTDPTPAWHDTADDELLRLYLKGWTQQQLAAQFGVSRQRISQKITRASPPWLMGWEARRRAARTRMRNAAAQHRKRVEKAVLCAVCGSLTLGRGTVLCSEECRGIYLGLRNHIDRPRLRSLAGKGRWLVRGSNTWESAHKCMERGYPIFERLPQQIQDQIVGRLHEPEGECERCSQPTDNPRFCSLDCYRSSGRIGVSA